ncbi:SET domain-containing protein-lysine N-methyltransferase [Pseudomarimonas arenosa]|uniref:SET domain-containing protein-lysine N-methyltransferase n=1 Tax=Pseudomarimonas arenosa TaxID=2774145 RepID=A0AAW3ZLT2_9GAMM|nr:SET domain-containing protein [Pseudomarimonas arenosa]MBD8526489.1 SET domain-containing protein-lysine N-methyltransferase [Pseudomarimonas arenosa]
MLLPRYSVAPSRIPGAGQGIFLREPIAAGRIIVAPEGIPQVYRWDEVLAMPDQTSALAASVRWFEDRFTVTLEWPDECYINHSFQPNGLWHLGFVFAARDIEADDELTVDYRHLLGEGQREEFNDAVSGESIIGWSWEESLRRSTAELASLTGV